MLCHIIYNSQHYNNVVNKSPEYIQSIYELPFHSLNGSISCCISEQPKYWEEEIFAPTSLKAFN